MGRWGRHDRRGDGEAACAGDGLQYFYGNCGEQPSAFWRGRVAEERVRKQGWLLLVIMCLVTLNTVKP